MAAIIHAGAVYRHAVSPEHFSGPEKFQQYLRNYPLPWFPQLDMLQRISEDFPMLVSPIEVQHIRRSVANKFYETLLGKDYGVDPKEMVLYLYDSAVTALDYITPGLLAQALDWESLKPIVIHIIRAVLGKEDADLADARFELDSFFDSVEREGDIAVTFEQREEYFEELVAEAQDAADEIQQSQYEFLSDDTSDAEHEAEMLLDEMIEELLTEIDYELDEFQMEDLGMLSHAVSSWRNFTEWYVSTEPGPRSLPGKTPRLRTNPRVIDINPED